MKKYIDKKDNHACEEVECARGKRIVRYYHLYCDICGAKHPDVCVNELYEEEGFPDGAYCWECQLSMREQGFVGEDKSIYFLKKDYPKEIDFAAMIDAAIKKSCSDKIYNKLTKNKEYYASLIRSIDMPGIMSMDFVEVKMLLENAKDISFSREPPKGCKGGIIMFYFTKDATFDEINERAENIIKKVDADSDFTWSAHKADEESVKIIWVK